MLPASLLLRCTLLIAPLSLTACAHGAPVRSAQPASKAMAIAQALRAADENHPLQKPITARAVLTYSHAVARQLDAKAAFTGLTGTRIGLDGTPARGGDWQLSYVGTEPLADRSGRPGNPYQQRYRLIAITVLADGRPKVEVTEGGMPLGQCFYEAPMPEVDSQEAIDRARLLRPDDEPVTAGFRLVLTGLMSTGHFNELVWKVSRTTQGADRPVLLNAKTGEPVLR